jgi:putative sigma-54 modulation protein
MNNAEKFANEGYQVSVIAKHFQITDAIRNYVLEKVAKVDRIVDHIIDVNVTLDTQKMEHSCSIFMNFIHFHIKVSASTDNLYSAIDKATDKLIRLVRKYKTKLQSHRAKHVSAVDIHVNVIQALKDDIKIINDEIQAETALEEESRYKLHEVVASEKMTLKTLTREEAIMKMEISDDPFLIFRSEEDQKLKLIYRREDRNYGLVHIQ